jgi:hypothetical protein
LALLAFGPARADAAAAAKLGLTSASVKSTSPEQKQITLTFDPCLSGSPGTLNIQSFDLSVGYNMADLDVVCVNFDSPFCPTGPVNNNLQGITGAANPTSTKPGDVDLFDVVFQLKPGVSINTPLTFTFGAGPNGYLHAIDSASPFNPFTGAYYSANQIVSTTIVASVAQGQICPTPLPATAGMSGAGLVGLLGLILWKRRQSPKAA